MQISDSRSTDDQLLAVTSSTDEPHPRLCAMTRVGGCDHQRVPHSSFNCP